MGWGCYKHEMDAGSKNWTKHAEELANEHLKKTGSANWGRDAEICPVCYKEMVDTIRETIEFMESMRHELYEQSLKNQQPAPNHIAKMVFDGARLEDQLKEHIGELEEWKQ